jgi:hypothetical protein
MAESVTSTEQAVSRIWDMANYSDKLSLSQTIQIFRDNWRDIILEELRNCFDSEESRQRLAPLITTEMNVCKMVIEKTALVYKEPAIRYAEVGEVEAEDGEMEGVHDERYDDVCEEARLNHVMQAADEYTRLVNHVLLRPVVRRGKMNVDIILPDNFDIYSDPNDFMDIVAIRYYVGQLSTAPQAKYSADIRESVMWVKRPIMFTSGQQTRMVEPGIYRIKQGQAIGDWFFEENPYFTTGKNGEKEYILPFVLTHKDYPIDRLLNFSNGSSIAESAVMFAVLMTMANELMKYQSYLMLVFSGPNDIKLPANIKVGPGNIFKAENGGQVSAIDVQAKIREFIDAIHSRVSTFAAQQGIPPSAFTLTGQPQSGYSLKVDRSTLVDIRNKSIPSFRYFEDELFEVMRVVNNHAFAGITKMLIPDSAEFHIDFAEMKFDPSPDEQMRKDTFDLSNNLVTPVDLIIRDNPDLSEDDAMALWQKNKMITASKVAAPLRQPGQINQPDALEQKKVETPDMVGKPKDEAKPS